MAVEETEIERIERELDILRTRQALYAKWGRVTTIVVAVIGAAIIIVVLAAIIGRYIGDPLFALFIIGILAVIGILIWIAGPALLVLAPEYRPDRIRRVKIVRYQVRPAGLVPLYKSYLHPYSVRQEMVEMIAWREQRLEELKRGRG